jgi:hypothetical protein
MENENKDKNIILTDEELKEVAGGTPVPGQNSLTTTCSTQKTLLGCMKIIICEWKDGECVPKKIS